MGHPPPVARQETGGPGRLERAAQRDKNLRRAGRRRVVTERPMPMMSPGAVYRIFQRADGEAPSVRAMVIALVVAAALLTTAGVIRVARQHEVLRLGFELSRRQEQVGRLQEARRRLELELATLAAPDRIRRLAAQLGMTPVSPDRIRVIRPAAQATTGDAAAHAA